jgi:DNA-binding SARP family transcriptional activator
LAWSASVERRISRLRRSALTVLAGDAQSRRDAGEMVRYAELIIEDDPCDEWGRSLAIRGYLTAGRETDAARQYLEYRRALRDELGIGLPAGDGVDGSLHELAARFAWRQI